MNVNKIIFECDNSCEIVYETLELIISDKLQKIKIPFNCKIYFCLKDGNKYKLLNCV